MKDLDLLLKVPHISNNRENDLVQLIDYAICLITVSCYPLLY